MEGRKDGTVSYCRVVVCWGEGFFVWLCEDFLRSDDDVNVEINK